MKSTPNLLFSIMCGVIFLGASAILAADKVPAEDAPPPSTPPANPAPQTSTIDELKDMPDGVLKIKLNDDGSFKSLVIKATVEIDTVLGNAKGKRAAFKDAQMQCKKSLTQWLDEQVVFVESENKVVTIQTKGEESTDAAGNKVKIRSQTGQETKVNAETNTSMAAACLKGLTTLYSEVTPSKESEYTLVLGLSQKNINAAAAAREALAKNSSGAGATGQPKTGTDDTPGGEKKVNPDADDFLK